MDLLLIIFIAMVVTPLICAIVYVVAMSVVWATLVALFLPVGLLQWASSKISG